MASKQEVLDRISRLRAQLDNLLSAVADDPAKVNAIPDAIKPWKPGTAQAPVTYTKDVDIRMRDNVPYLCAQTHTHRGEANWAPGVAPSLWFQYHGTSPETARPFVAVTGAHDVYRLGEYAIWTDGEIYTPAVDNMAYSPGDYPQGWLRAE